MKRVIILLVFLCFAKINIAQLYKPFPTDSSMWRESAFALDVTYSDYWDYQYCSSGDTVLLGKTYHKLSYTGVYVNNQTGFGITYYNTLNQYKGCYREDTTKRILFCPYGDTIEQVLYDFNLSVGDTLPPSYINSPGSGNWVSAIDSILVGGQYHKQYLISRDTSMSWEFNYVSLIEGVGSTYGLLGKNFGPLMPIFESGSTLNCYSHNGTTEYIDSLSTSCDSVILGIMEESAKAPITTFPNPTTGTINIKTPFSEKTEISIWDVLGNTIYKTEFSSAENTINLSQFPKGIYFLKATSGNKFSTTQKIVLQ